MEKTCIGCGSSFSRLSNYGWGKRTFCYGCRPLKTNGKGAQCAGGCGRLMHISAGSLPAGKATCRQCRGLSDTPRRRTCIDCSEPSWGIRCRPCIDASHGTRDARAEAKRLLKSRRYERDRQAPGPYTQMARRHLLAKWQKQGRQCAYCRHNPAEQVDHVIPLALGGTNYEGNLVPACADCNRRKMDNLLSAWRYDIQVRKWRTAVQPRPKAIRPPAPTRKRRAVQVAAKWCPICGALHTHPNAVMCSDECRVEQNRRLNRDAYRARVGLPFDPSKPTKKWRVSKAA